MKYQVTDENIDVEIGRKPFGGAWISVGDPHNGPHFQCDYLRDPEQRPESVSDFGFRPPKWVVGALGLSRKRSR